MKNKLLLSSALISGLAFAGSALAETKITGSMDISLGSRSSDTAIKSSSGFGSETQLNISNSGTLNNGMGYAAGFSMESDTSTDAFENAYINLTLVKGTMLHFGSDHFPGIDGTVTPKVSIAADTLAGGGTAGTTGNISSTLLYVDGTYVDAVETQGVGILQDIGSAGKIGIYYTPSMQNTGGSTGNDAVNHLETANSAIGYSFRGNLGVDGLSLLAGIEKEKKGPLEIQDIKSRNIGISYNFGKFAIGVSQMNHDLPTGSEMEAKEAGITFAASDNLSFGISYHESDPSGTGVETDRTEEITMVQAGYNLGGASVSLNYAQVENTGGGTNDDEFLNLRIGTKF
jgi:hypothetical protein